ncbi:MAG: LURP-one-related family protein [Lachnospiraceae bacterium]|nr:LURP-one-related family protein [Lachnospiraceae bacterium]
MKLLIKQRIVSWSDTYDIYDENDNKKYLVEADIIALKHCLRVYDKNNHEIGVIRQRMMSFLPCFDVEVRGKAVGTIQKKFSFFKPEYELDYNGWRLEGDYPCWDYDVYEGCSSIIHISKEVFHWGDTYVIDFVNPADELLGLMLVIAIDAADCIHH